MDRTNESTIDHGAVIAGLNREERRALTERSDGRGLLQLAGHLGALAVTGGWIVMALPGWQGVLLIHGVLVVFLFTALHETIHKTAFRTDALNAVVAHAAGFVLFLPPRWFRYFHFAHHRHTQDPGRDPELASPKPETWTGYLWHLSGLPVWWVHLRTLAANAAGRCEDTFVPARGKARVRREAQVFLAGYALLAVGSVLLGNGLLIWIWLVPALLGQPFLRAYLLAEHGRCAFVANMLANSRTTFTNAVVRFIAWNMPYHAEHHAYPAVPFHRLGDFHRHTRRHLHETQTGYAAFHLEHAPNLKRGDGRKTAPRASTSL